MIEVIDLTGISNADSILNIVQGELKGLVSSEDSLEKSDLDKIKLVLSQEDNLLRGKILRSMYEHAEKIHETYLRSNNSNTHLANGYRFYGPCPPATKLGVGDRYLCKLIYLEAQSTIQRDLSKDPVDEPPEGIGFNLLRDWFYVDYGYYIEKENREIKEEAGIK